MITKTCEICGKTFQVQPCRDKTARFCSRVCGGVWHAKNRLKFQDRSYMLGNTHRCGLSPTRSYSKGNVPWNAGLKGIHCSPASEFKPGQTPVNKLPIGSTRVRACKGGLRRAFVKVAEPNVWTLRAIVVWEKAHGPIPKGFLIHHHDRNPLNDSLKNLRLMTRSAHMLEHRLDFEAERIEGLRKKRRGTTSSR